MRRPAYSTSCRRMDFGVVFFKFYFTAIVNGAIALNVVCLKRWKQELLDELFCLDQKQESFKYNTTVLVYRYEHDS